MLETIITVLTSVLIAATGWYTVHCCTILRDLKNKQNEMRFQALIKAYRLLFSSMEQAYIGDPPYKYATKLKEAYPEIQLFADMNINEYMKKLYDELKVAIKNPKEKVSFEIVQEIRDTIRRNFKFEENRFNISFPLIVRKDE